MTSGSGFVSTGGPRVEKIGHILENIVSTILKIKIFKTFINIKLVS